MAQYKWPRPNLQDLSSQHRQLSSRLATALSSQRVVLVAPAFRVNHPRVATVAAWTATQVRAPRNRTSPPRCHLQWHHASAWASLHNRPRPAIPRFHLFHRRSRRGCQPQHRLSTPVAPHPGREINVHLTSFHKVSAASSCCSKARRIRSSLRNQDVLTTGPLPSDVSVESDDLAKCV